MSNNPRSSHVSQTKPLAPWQTFLRVTCLRHEIFSVSWTLKTWQTTPLLLNIIYHLANHCISQFYACLPAGLLDVICTHSASLLRRFVFSASRCRWKFGSISGSCKSDRFKWTTWPRNGLCMVGSIHNGLVPLVDPKLSDDFVKGTK